MPTDPDSDPDPVIANAAVVLAMEWGANFSQPIHPRLAAQFPDLTADALDRYHKLAKDVEHAAYGIIAEEAERLTLNGPVGAASIVRLRGQYPWVSDATFVGLLTRGQYYAWHDGIGT